MGLIEKLLRPTPFYPAYKKFLTKKAEREQAELEAKLHPLRVRFYQQFIEPGSLVFDVGANVGNRVSAFLENGAKVVAFEPQPQCVQVLQNKFGKAIIIENVGLGQVEGELEMHIATDSTVSSFNKEYIENTKDRFKYTQWVNTIKVPVKTFDQMIEKHGVPKFCKIDVEGYELEVLKGLNHKVPFLSLEYCVPEVHQQLIDCLERLHSLSPQGQYNYSIGESMEWAQPMWMNFEAFKQHIKSQDFIKTSFGDIYFKSSV